MNDFKPYVGRRVLVYTDFMTFEGTLSRAGRDDVLVLEHGAAVADDGTRSPIDGDTVIPRLQVLWVQVP